MTIGQSIGQCDRLQRQVLLGWISIYTFNIMVLIGMDRFQLMHNTMSFFDIEMEYVGLIFTPTIIIGSPRYNGRKGNTKEY